MKDHFSIQIATKSYLAKYLKALYGDPIVFNANNYFGTSLIGYLDSRIYRQNEAHFQHRNFDTYNTTLSIYLPSFWLSCYQYQTEISKGNIIYLNKHFEEKFEEELTRHCFLFDLVGIGRKQAMEDFCTRFGIEIEVDIRFEALKQKEYRARKKIERNLSKSVPRKNRTIQPRIL